MTLFVVLSSCLAEGARGQLLGSDVHSHLPGDSEPGDNERSQLQREQQDQPGEQPGLHTKETSLVWDAWGVPGEERTQPPATSQR